MKKPPSKRGKALDIRLFPSLEQERFKLAALGRLFCAALLVWLLTPHVGQPLNAQEPEKMIVRIDDNGLVYESEVYGTSVGQVLEELDIVLGEGDMVSPVLEYAIAGQTDIYIRRYPVWGQGVASWYARGLPQPLALTAASRDFPRGTRLRVHCLDTERNVNVVINDYGPEAWTGRIIDLSLGAFREIQDPGLGLTRVEIIPL